MLPVCALLELGGTTTVEAALNRASEGKPAVLAGGVRSREVTVIAAKLAQFIEAAPLLAEQLASSLYLQHWCLKWA